MRLRDRALLAYEADVKGRLIFTGEEKEGLLSGAARRHWPLLQSHIEKKIEVPESEIAATDLHGVIDDDACVETRWSLQVDGLEMAATVADRFCWNEDPIIELTYRGLNVKSLTDLGCWLSKEGHGGEGNGFSRPGD